MSEMNEKVDEKVDENTDEKVDRLLDNSLTSVDRFLIYLAKHASHDRFMPFPDCYRIAPVDKSTVEEKDKIAIEQLGASFSPYTEEEYEAMKKDLNKLEGKPSAYPELLKYIKNIELGMSKHGINSIHPLIDEYEFRYSELEERIRDIKHGKRWYLYHGSVLGNWHSILRNGLKKMSNTAYMSAGAALGLGVYLTTDMQTASFYGNRGGSTCCVSVVEILEDPAPYMKPGGVYVIPDDTILVVRYLFKISGPVNFDGKEILQYYEKMTNKRLEDKGMVRRITGEITNLEKRTGVILVEKYSNEILTVIFDEVLLRVYLKGFPFYPPIIQPVYEYETNIKKHNAIFCPASWSPAAGILDTLVEYRQVIFDANKLPEMSSREIAPIYIPKSKYSTSNTPK